MLKLLAEEFISNFSSIKEKYYELQSGKVSVIEFKDILLPFLSKIIIDRNYKKLLGDKNTRSINLLLINLQDKFNAYESQKDLGNEQAARQEQKDVLDVATRIVNRLEDVIDTMEKGEDNSNNYVKKVNIDTNEKIIAPLSNSKSTKRIFISYARADSQQAKRLYKDLKQAGANPWIDTEDLIGGELWEPTIKKAIKDSRYFIALLSSNSVEKIGYVQAEVKNALDVFARFPSSKIFIIPVRLDDSTIDDDKINKIHMIDMFPDWNSGINRILRAIQKSD